jgi:hypothetical protein
MNKQRIAVIMPYFGKWPEWIDLYMYSCGNNSFIDWYFFTDCDKLNNAYPNVFIQTISFTDYCRHVSESLKIEFNPDSPYKLCDLRPFYGCIYQDILKEYEFWGFGDIDVIWGDIVKFYTNKKLDNYDVFSTHNDRLSGHFCLLRNNEKYQKLCFEISDWKMKLEDKTNYILDESDYSRIIFPESKWIGKFYRQIMMKYLGWKIAWEIYYTFFPVIHLILGLKRRRLYFKEQHTTPILNSDGRLYKYESDSWHYKEGRIYNDRVNRDYIYLHFMIYKRNNIKKEFHWKEQFYSIPNDYNYANGIIVNKNGICKLNK